METSLKKIYSFIAFFSAIIILFFIFRPIPVSGDSNTASQTPVYAYRVIKTYIHNQDAFTEGLVLDDNYLYESTGLYQESKLRKSELATGKVIKEYSLPLQYFAEGITIIGNLLYQITYKEHTGFVYDKNTFALQKTFNFMTDGWGLTNDGSQLIMSNGTDVLYYLDLNSFSVTGTLQVRDHNVPIMNLNGLLYLNGNIYANVWPTDKIAIISPKTGQVKGWIDISLLNPYAGDRDTNFVANGIAYDAENQALLVTGKNWPSIFAIQLINPIQ